LFQTKQTQKQPRNV